MDTVRFCIILYCIMWICIYIQHAYAHAHKKAEDVSELDVTEKTGCLQGCNVVSSGMKIAPSHVGQRCLET